MQRLLQLFLFILVSAMAFGQENFNLELVANISVGEDGNDVWGYVDADSVEYAIMGTRTTTKIWSLEDPSMPIQRASIPGPAGTWRDIKSYEDHLYVTSDQGTDGLLIIDMSEAPETITSQYWKPNLTVDGLTQPLNKCHNLYIDTETGLCYLSGCNNSNQGVLILDLKQDKKEPVLIGNVDKQYSHDAYVLDNKLYSSDILAGVLSIYDVEDPTSPVFLGETSTSRNFTHNAWTSHDGNFAFTTDERANAWVDSYDVSDPNDIKFLDRYKPLETENTGVIPHNTHYLNGYLITSWYTDGVVILDATKPDNLIKVGSYDTELSLAGGFDGTWGAYPFLPSGLVLGSDINNGLFVFQPKNENGDNGYQRAAYLEGEVTDANTGAQIANVTVTIVAVQPNLESTDIMGQYKTGLATEGTFEVTFSHPNYDAVTLEATIVSGEVTILNAQLGNSIISGSVVNVETGDPIANATIVLEDRDSESRLLAETNNDGVWTTGARADASYDLYVGKWGYRGATQEAIIADNNEFSTELELGYEDDFFGDLGWSSTGFATSGQWEIGRPNTIDQVGFVTQTEFDIDIDLGTTYYVTGASGEGAGENDVDDGFVTLTSPAMEMSEFNRLTLSFYLWFANGGGNTDPNDMLQVSLSNGITLINLTTINESSSVWSENLEFTVSADDIEFTDNMTLIFTATDDNPGHVTEAGVDVFRAEGFNVNSTSDLTITDTGLSIYPNPASDIVNIQVKKTLEGNNAIQIMDNAGRILRKDPMSTNEKMLDISILPSGIYNLQVIGKTQISEVVRFIKK